MRQPTSQRVEGTTQFDTIYEPWFKCRWTYNPAPDGDDPQQGRRRTPRTGTFMCALRDTDGNTLDIRSADRIELNSPQLGRATFELTSDGEPIRKKRRMLGWMATATRIEEHEFIKPIRPPPAPEPEPEWEFDPEAP